MSFCRIAKCNFKTVLPATEELAQRLDIHQTWHRFMCDGGWFDGGEKLGCGGWGLSFENTTKMYSEFSNFMA